MRRCGLGLTALVLAATTVAAPAVLSPAGAADLPAPAPAYYPPVMHPALYDWTGFYIGGQVGVNLLSDTASQAGPLPTTPILNSASVRPDGVIGGGQIGVNYEFAPWVVGVEGSWTMTTLTGSNTVTAVSPPAAAGTFERATSAPKWLISATGRFGYAANDLLFYGKGGFAWMQVDYTQDLLNSGVTFATQSISNMRTGFTGGGGLEYGLTENLSARLEYDFYDFGTKAYNFAQTPVSIKSQMNVVAVGLNYSFRK
jgi:outer membrane immunogenic protein